MRLLKWVLILARFPEPSSRTTIQQGFLSSPGRKQPRVGKPKLECGLRGPVSHPPGLNGPVTAPVTPTQHNRLSASFERRKITSDVPKYRPPTSITLRCEWSLATFHNKSCSRSKPASFCSWNSRLTLIFCDNPAPISWTALMCQRQMLKSA